MSFPQKMQASKYYLRWLVAMPIFYTLGLVGARQTPLPIKVLCTVVVASIYLYIFKLYKNSSRA